MIKYGKLAVALMTGTVMLFSVTGCTMPWESAQNTDTTVTVQAANATSSVKNTDNVTAATVEWDSEDLDAGWEEASATKIHLTGASATVSGDGAEVTGQTVTITSAGTYVISGTLTDGNINVAVADKETVHLVLNGVTITSTTTAPLTVTEAKKVIVTLADGTTNAFTDSARSTTESEDYSAAITSKADLVFNGTGTLHVNAGYRNGIKSSDDLKIVSGTYKIVSAEDGIVGKDLLGIKEGTFTIQSGQDGMKSTYDKDDSKGHIVIEGGTFNIQAQTDGIQAEHILQINGGTFTIKTAGGAAASTKSSAANTMSQMGGRMTMNTTTSTQDEESMKGLKAGTSIVIADGTYTIDSQDDAVHCNGDIIIANGTFTIQTGDDGVHADNSLTINGGTIDIQKSYEGLEAAIITINAGDVKVVASDDGINAAEKSSSTETGTGTMMMQKGMESASSNAQLIINGGNIYVNAAGDGLDANGSITFYGGTTIISGPTSNGDAALDFDTNCVMNGGTVMAFGSSGMLEIPTDASNGACIATTFTSVAANSTFSVQDSSGKTILSYTPEKSYESAIVYSTELQTGSTYTINAGSTSQSITVSDAVTTNGNISAGMNGGMRGGNMKGGNFSDGNMSDGTMKDGKMQDGNFSDGNRPELPDGDAQDGSMPDMQNGEIPNDNGNMSGGMKQAGGRGQMMQ